LIPKFASEVAARVCELRNRNTKAVPARFELQVSLPGLTRQSIIFAKHLAKRMDPRVKPAGDAQR
jgi:hypothetical protein